MTYIIDSDDQDQEIRDLTNRVDDLEKQLALAKKTDASENTLPITDVNAPLIADLTTELINATNEIMERGVIGDTYTNLDNKIKRISSTLNVINGR